MALFRGTDILAAVEADRAAWDAEVKALAVTETRIREAADDEALFKLLSEELQRRLPDEESDDLDEFLRRLDTLSVGLQAMAAIYQLDVSLALDDLGWHFANWHHRGYCDKTLWALRELEAFEEAELFERAYAIAQRHWDEVGALLDKSFDDFTQWYSESEFETATMPMTERLWELCRGADGKFEGLLLKYWTRYARKYPGRVAQSS